MPQLFCLGYGQCAAAASGALMADHWRLVATTRSQQKVKDQAQQSLKLIEWSADQKMPAAYLSEATALLVSIAPSASPMVANVEEAIMAATKLKQIIYLSATSVYGDTGGAWVDESAAVSPASERGIARAAAEKQWQKMATQTGKALCILRLSGIYGPKRNPVNTILTARAQNAVDEMQIIKKEDHFFNRVHVDDVGRAINAVLTCAHPVNDIFNLSDDLPAPFEDPYAYAAARLGIALPAFIRLEQAQLSKQAKGFWSENKRILNDKIKKNLAFSFQYPTYRDGIDRFVQDA